ncbi:hypothetical protein COCSUDRAFT_59065 [Coccomyxa subellipsoidea C-169]|uniref:Myb-like domain-containing protein n=1 Tax=Coccomyxa subellipsoidea (strain C-169) TaxID=574566 RepID=I0Z7B9_COCSC|nr:hypothetical protein COCSUDRAFT_59065 [Coccomyxa subellipsoidea C-169]EIE26538.1 hypothetical protein COCSUDRAFT_59065 [Coccomyxa subellipsoidea C-169]|eukprot:XP_005651082.1 hypothetical protein COCSUDRAFT_59065 [Coccomyxa subellipsoidea C-169]
MRTRNAVYQPTEALETETKSHEKLKAKRAKKKKMGADLLRKREAKKAAEQAEQAELDTDTTEEASASPKRGRGRPRKSLATIAAPFRAPITSVGPSSPGGPSLPQRPAPASPSVRQAREPPQQPTGGGSGAVRQLAAAAARPQHVPTWGLAQDAARKKAEDAAVEVARQSGRYVDVAVHSFITEIPPSRLAVPEDATINFLRRQIQYRVEELGTHMPADALEVQVKDTWGTLTPTTSFTATGAEKTVRSYGLVPGQQHHIWVIVVDDTAARDQRAATAALIDMPGAPTPWPSRLAPAAAGSPVPARRFTEPAQHAVAQYQAELSPARPARAPDAAANPATESPGRRRQKNKRWSDEERDALINGVTILGTGHWAAILDRYTTIFAPGRNSVDIKDKWRNLVKLAQQKREARGGTLPREQVVKILEVIHREEHPDSEPEDAPDGA